MPVWTGAVAIGMLGTVTLTGMTYRPADQARLVAAVVPPWQQGGMVAAAATGLAVVDLRWRGHVMILDTGGDPAVKARLRAQGYWLVDATGARGCGSTKGTAE